MLDAKTLAFALTDQGINLEGACELFGVEHGKQKVKRHGIVTPKYIDYNRRDVLATYELTEKLLAEYALHPIPLQATKAYSAASIGKAYLEAMGVTPLLARMPDFPKRYLGYAESAFFGGRASAHVRKVPVPIVYTDFMSQYSTVNVLMGLWNFVTARRDSRRREMPARSSQRCCERSPEWLLDQATGSASQASRASSRMATCCRCEPSTAVTIGRSASTTSMRAATIRTMRSGIRGPISSPRCS